MFPVKKTRRVSAKVKKVEEFNVYCTCRMPVTPASELIQCADVRSGTIQIRVFKWKKFTLTLK